DVDARMAQSFYDIIHAGDPTVFVNGFDGASGLQNEKKWESLVSDPSVSQYPGTISGTVNIEPDGRLKVDVQANNGGSGVQVRAYIMVVESKIYYANTDQYGNPPDSLWNNIFRGILPSPQGGPIINFSGQYNYPFYFDPKDKPWNLNN